MRVLVVEDDRELAGILAQGFGEHHIETVVAGTVARGRERAALGRTM